jgi:Xaa-Pro aminopeptidase
MADAALDLVAIAPTDNLRYLLGFAPHSDERLCLLLISGGEEAMVVPALNAEQIASLAPGLRLADWDDAAGPAATLAAVLRSLGVSGAARLAVDPELRADHLLALEAALPHATVTNASSLIAPLREIKDDHELDLLRRCAELDDAAVRAAYAALEPGMTELELADVVAGTYRERGGAPEFTIVGGGPNSAFPHHATGSRRFETGDAVVLDVGGRLDDYPSDITRMAFVGDPSERYREIHAIVEAAVQAGIAAAKPGVSCADVDAAARKVIADAGYGEYFTHRLGHGLGISVHEAPWIMAGNDAPLRAGAVHSIEPGIYLPGEFGVRLEEIVHVDEDGAHRLSSLPREVHIAHV